MFRMFKKCESETEIEDCVMKIYFPSQIEKLSYNVLQSSLQTNNSNIWQS